MKTISLCLRALLILGLLALLSNCGDTTKSQSDGDSAPQARQPFKVALLTWVGYAPIYLAKEKGFFEGIDVDIKLIEDTAARRAAFASGDVDASVDIISSFANLLASNVAASVVMKLDDSTGGDGIIVKEDITSIQDLKGKTIAYPPGQPSHYFLLALLEDEGMAIDDLQSRYMEPDQAGSAFISGSVDGAVTWEPWLTKAANKPGARVLITSREKPGLISDIFTVRNSFLEKHSEVVQAFMRGWFKAVAYWRNNPKEANYIMANAMKVDIGEFEQMVSGVRYSDFQTNQEFFKKDAQGNSGFTEALARASRIWKQEGLVKKDIQPQKADASHLLDNLNP